MFVGEFQGPFSLFQNIFTFSYRLNFRMQKKNPLLVRICLFSQEDYDR